MFYINSLICLEFFIPVNLNNDLLFFESFIQCIFIIFNPFSSFSKDYPHLPVYQTSCPLFLLIHHVQLVLSKYFCECPIPWNVIDSPSPSPSIVNSSSSSPLLAHIPTLHWNFVWFEMLGICQNFCEFICVPALLYTENAAY